MDRETQKICVTKRGKDHEPFRLDKLMSRIKKQCYQLDQTIDPICIANEIHLRIKSSSYSTAQIDKMISDISFCMSSTHPDYAILASRIAVSALHKKTKKLFSHVISDLHKVVNEATNEPILISNELNDFVQHNANILNHAINYDHDYDFTFAGFNTLFNNYLLRINSNVVERPQQMLMRVAVGIHLNDINSAITTYNWLAKRYFLFAPITLLNVGLPRSHLTSSFLLSLADNDIGSIYDTLKNYANCAKLVSTDANDGIGVNVNCIREDESDFSKTVVSMMNINNNTARFFDVNTRTGVTIYIEPWHPDIMNFLSTISESSRLNYALWIPDIFMNRINSNDYWSLMCPSRCSDLQDLYGKKFETRYKTYEADGVFLRRVSASKLFDDIIKTQAKSCGKLYLVFKDSCNSKSNQKNRGTIKCSSFCTELVQYSAKDEIAVGNSASIALNRFVDKEKHVFDFDKLKDVVKVVTCCLNKIIDVTQYPTIEAKTSNLRNRPIGIGVQGLSDAFILMRFPFEGEEAKKLNLQIFETIYFGALEASCELAQRDKHYATYKGCPADKGDLQYDMWKVVPSDMWDWKTLKQKIAQHGLKNSLLIAQASSATAQILGNSPSVDPYTSCLFSQSVSYQEYEFVNPNLQLELMNNNVWNEDLLMKIRSSGGILKDLDEISNQIKSLYKTFSEISTIRLLEMAVDRGAFIDQNQCLKIYLPNINIENIKLMNLQCWTKGLKSGFNFYGNSVLNETSELVNDGSDDDDSVCEFPNKKKRYMKLS